MLSRALVSKWVIHRVSRRLQIGRAGAVAIVTALCAPILVMIVGFVVDFSYASYINQRLARATDAATIGSVSQTAGTAGGGYANLSFLQTFGTNYFNANTTQLGVTGINFNLNVTSDGYGGVIANGSYSGNVPTFFAAALGISNIPISGAAKTAARPLTYVNYYILVDNSQSMGIGATQSDMTALYQRVLAKNNASPAVTSGSSAPGDGGCVFGCHTKQQIRTSSGSLKYQDYTNEDLAHNTTGNWGSFITLRIDSAIQAVNNIVSSAAQIAATTKNIKFGIYTIGEDTGTGKSVGFIKNPPTTDYAAVQTATSTIDLVTTDGSQNTGNTDFHDEVTDFFTGIGGPMTQGSGASATSPVNYIVLITDGLGDVNGNCTSYNVCISTIDATDCNTLKANATLGVIYTTYLPIYQYNASPTLENRFNKLVTTSRLAAVKSALQSCATSSDWFFEAQDGPALVSAMQTLFQRTQPISARISQ